VEDNHPIPRNTALSDLFGGNNMSDLYSGNKREVSDDEITFYIERLFGNTTKYEEFVNTVLSDVEPKQLAEICLSYSDATGHLLQEICSHAIMKQPHQHLSEKKLKFVLFIIFSSQKFRKNSAYSSFISTSRYVCYNIAMSMTERSKARTKLAAPLSNYKNVGSPLWLEKYVSVFEFKDEKFREYFTWVARNSHRCQRMATIYFNDIPDGSIFHNKSSQDFSSEDATKQGAEFLQAFKNSAKISIFGYAKICGISPIDTAIMYSARLLYDNSNLYGKKIETVIRNMKNTAAFTGTPPKLVISSSP
jgi:hypothetical protein